MNARQPRDFRQPVRYARRGCASPPASYDLICDRRLLSCLLRITRDSSRQEKSAVTYVPINSVRNPRTFHVQQQESEPEATGRKGPRKVPLQSGQYVRQKKSEQHANSDKKQSRRAQQDQKR